MLLRGLSLRTAPLALAWESIAVPVHLDARAVGQEILCFGARGHLRADLPTIASESGLASRLQSWRGAGIGPPHHVRYFRLGRRCCAGSALLALSVELFDCRAWGLLCGCTWATLKSDLAIRLALMNCRSCNTGCAREKANEQTYGCDDTEHELRLRVDRRRACRSVSCEA